MRLLIVEDEYSVGTHIKDNFQAVGFVCDLLDQGSEAIEAILVDDYDCIILDRRLGKMDGLEICREIRANGVETPVLILTALTGVDETVDGLEAGADDYLTKPFSIDELIARVNALIRRNSYKNNPILSVRDVSINTAKRYVTVNGNVADLSNREFQLLEYLMRNAGKPLTRLQILDRVWESNTNLDSNIVDVYIKFLRNKIDQDPDSPSNIDTVRGYGYRFREKI